MPYRFAILEDEPLSVQLLSSYLDRLEKVRLVIVTDDPDAVEDLITAGLLDLVLLDVNIKGSRPGHLGRLLEKDCRFIIVTAYPYSYLHDLAPGTIYGYLSKPVSFIVFRREVRRVLGDEV